MSNSTLILALAILFFLFLIFVLWVIVRKSAKNNTTVDEDPSFWEGKDYKCPNCGTEMQKGYALCGKGIIWAQKAGKQIGLFANIGQALANTMSWRVSPALNMAWRCVECRILLIDHSKLVKPKQDKENQSFS